MTSLSEYLQAKQKLVKAAKAFEAAYSDDRDIDSDLSGYYPPEPSRQEAEDYDHAVHEIRTTYPKLLAALESALGALEAITQERSHCTRCDSRDALAEEAVGRIERILEVKP